jgi:hypothetical protein
VVAATAHEEPAHNKATPKRLALATATNIVHISWKGVVAYGANITVRNAKLKSFF